MKSANSLRGSARRVRRMRLSRPSTHRSTVLGWADDGSRLAMDCYASRAEHPLPGAVPDGARGRGAVTARVVHTHPFC